MKKTLLLLLLAPVMLFSSCSSDDDGTPLVVSKDQLKGTWSVYQYAANADNNFVSVPAGLINVYIKDNNYAWSATLSSTNVVASAGTYTLVANRMVGVAVSTGSGTSLGVETFTFEKLAGDSTTISYSSTTGLKYRAKARRTSTTVPLS